MNELLEKHARVGKVLSAAFKANEEPMVEWAEIGFEIKELQEKLKKSLANEGSLQACVDRLMMEYCPEEITEEQYEEWANNQAVADVPEFEQWVKTLGYKEE